MLSVVRTFNPEIQLDLRESELNRRESALIRREQELVEIERDLRGQMETFHQRYRRAELLMTQARADRSASMLRPLRITA
jgi:hypothetical protein